MRASETGPGPEKSRPQHLRHLITGVIIAVVSLACGIGALELGVRFLRPQKQFTCTVNAWDRTRGTKQMEGARGFVVIPEYSINLVINSKGLRDREYPYAKPEETRRILCLGGSFTCGYGVEAGDTYAKVLERTLKAGAGGPRWEVLNAGVGSTGTANHVAFYEVEGYKYKPDLIFLDFCQNDFHDNVISGLYTLENGSLVKHDAPSTIWRRVQSLVRFVPGYRGIFARSQLLNFVKVRVAKRHFHRLDAMAQRAESEADLRAAEDALTRALVLSLRRTCEQGGARLVVVFMPRVDYGDWPKATLELMDFLNAQGIPLVDLAPAFKQEADRGVELAYPQDHHWNKAGHELAAKALYGFVDANYARLGPLTGAQ